MMRATGLDIVLAVVLCGIVACGGGHHGGVDAAAGDDASDASPDAPPFDTGADIADTLQCGPNDPVGPGNAAEFQLATIDLSVFPDALCNDGTPAVAYFRPYNGEANRNKWLLNLHGGGSCGSGPSCAARWCNCANTTVCPYVETPTGFDRSTMTNERSPMKSADGIFLRGGTGAQTNPLGDWNQVVFLYCSSDTWRGNLKGVTMSATNPVTGEPVTFKLNFLGSKILDGDIAWLRQDGVPGLVYTLGGGSMPMPDLDDATDVVVSGDSAGGAGVIHRLDYMRELLAAHTNNASPPAVSGLIDAYIGIDREPLDYGTFIVPQVRSYDDYLTLKASATVASGARLDESCLQQHAADARICHDEMHVIRNHVTTPFFVRMALRDSLIGGGYVEEMLRLPDMTPLTINNFAVRLHDELAEFDTLAGEETPTKEPGVFAPACTDHDTIHTTLDTYGTTITPMNGTAQRLMPVFESWRIGTGNPPNVLTESLTLDDTECAGEP